MHRFANHTTVLNRRTNLEADTKLLQSHLQNIEKWPRKWRIQVDPTKSTNITFIMKKYKTYQLN